jgi:hypothetical protein
LALSLHDRAQAALAGKDQQARTHLGLAVAQVTTRLRGSLCPGVPAGLGNEVVCATAWKLSAKPADQALLARAWKSAQGRDDAAIEGYIGLVHVVPWLYGAFLAQVESRAALAQSFEQRIVTMRAAADEATRTSPRFESLVLFVDALAAAMRASMKRQPGQRVRVEPGRAEQLYERALALAKKSPQERFTQGAVLAVAALLAQEREVLELVEALPGELHDRHRLPRDVLRVWSAVLSRTAPLAGDAAGGITELINNGQLDEIERAKLVLLLAESDYAVTGSERSRDVLGKVGGELAAGNAPTALRLRGVLDSSGAFARGGAAAQAIRILEPAAGGPPGKGEASTETDLAFAALTALLGLQGMEARGQERKEYADRLAELTKSADAATVPASVLLYHRAVSRKLASRIEEERCGAMAVCVARAKKQGALSNKEIDDAVGAQSGKMFRAGILPAGTLNLSFNYSASSGLILIVQLEPRLLAPPLLSAP